MDITRALAAGAIQGFTEFLPISSSGHLAVFYHLSGEAEGADLSFSVLLHFGTLLAVVIVFRRDIYALLHAFFLIIKNLINGKTDFKPPERRLLVMLIIGTVPAVVVGGAVKLLKLDDYFSNIFIVAALFAVTAAFMLLTDRLKESGAETEAPYKAALLAGALQSAAILPGLSRSGATIFGGRLGGLTKEFAVKFAFLLSVPAILGAAVVEGTSIVKHGFSGIDPAAWAAGFLTAFVCGMLSIGAIKVIAKHNKFFVFGIYCLLASAFSFAAAFGLIF